MNYSQYKEFIKKQKEIFIENKTKLEYGAVTKKVESHYKLTKSFEVFVNNIFDTAKFHDYFKIMAVLANENRIQTVDSPLINKVVNVLKYNPKTETVSEKLQESFKDLGMENTNPGPGEILQHIDTFTDLYNDNEELYKEIQNTIKEAFISELKTGYTAGNEADILNGFFEKMDTLKEKTDVEIDFEKLVPDENTYLTARELGDKTDVHTHDKEITELKNENIDDKEYIEALDKANDLIVMGISNLVTQQSNIAEYEGEKSDHIRAKEILEDIKQNNDVKDLFKTDKIVRMLNPKIDFSYEDIVKLEKDNSTTSGLKDLNFTEKIINLANKMKQYGFIEEDFRSEQGTKDYSLKALTAKANDVKEAVKNKDRDAIIKNVNEYKEKEKQYDELVSDVKNINDGPNFVSNLSATRSRYVPFKYRQDYKNVSKLSALYISAGFCQASGIDFDEFVKDPLSVVKKVGLERVQEKSEVYKLLKTKQKNVLDMLYTLEKGVEDPTMQEASSKDTQIFKGFTRAVDGILSLYPDKKEANKIFKEYQFASLGSLHRCSQLNTSFHDPTFLNANTISNIFLMSEKDNPMELSPAFADVINPITLEKFEPKFNRQRALENVDVKELVDKIFDVQKKYVGTKANAVVEGITKTCTDVLRVNRNLTADDKNVLGAISRNEVIPKVHLTNFYTSKFLESINKEGLSNNNVDNVLKELAETKKAYDSRSIFAKIFYSGVRRQGNLIDSLTKKLTDAGIKKDDINNCIKAYGGDTDPIKSVDSINAIRNQLSENKLIKDNKEIKADINQIENDNLQNKLSNEFDDFVVVDYKDNIVNEENIIVNELEQDGINRNS